MLDLTDTRRLFRNRLECYVHHKNSSGAGVLDGSRLTLRDLCLKLQGDDEPFPRYRYDDVRKICGHEYLTWLRTERSYGDVVRLLSRLLASEDGLEPPVGGRWVHDALKNPRPSSFWLQSDREIAETLASME